MKLMSKNSEMRNGTCEHHGNTVPAIKCNQTKIRQKIQKMNQTFVLVCILSCFGTLLSH